MRSSSVEEVGGHGPGDPWEVFTALAILVVEGRTPGGERGYHAGPHCPLPHQLQHKHSCDPNDHMCIQAGALVRQLRVMWGVGVGVSLEVLVAPECKHGAALATTLDTTIAPSQNLRLIEQWNFTIYDKRHSEATATGWSLVAAVRSFLHFSQLSAWLSVSRGCRPPNVLYRLTVTSPVFCSKFTEEAEEHVFPLAYMGQETSIKVAVRSLPRSEKVPVVICPEHHEEDAENVLSAESLPTCSQNKADMARCEEDLRRSVMKARLVENTRVSRSESPDTQLGESLLDPPNSLTRFPRRYQSPSRSGSPSLETPEHLICRHRHPVPPNSRPPDVSMMMGSSVARQPFSWTQARYPLPPMNLHPGTSVASACSTLDSCMMAQGSQQLQHHSHHHLLPQSPYRIDYSEPCVPYQRPQLVYSRPLLCLSQVQHAQLTQQHKAESVHPHHHRTLQHPMQSTSFEVFEKQYDRLSPRGGKYQNYPEYQYSDVLELEDDQVMSGEYSEPPKKCKSQKPVSGEYSESNACCKAKHKGEHLDPSMGLQSTSSCSSKGEVFVHQEEEYQGGWESKKNYHYGNMKQYPQVSMDVDYHQVDSLPRSSSGKVPKAHTKHSSYVIDDKKNQVEEHAKVIDDQLRPCCSYTGKHLCSSMEDLSDVCDKSEVEGENKGHLHPKDLKQELKHKGNVSPSHLFHNKFNFDLTPKETMEILSVLRHSSNMRIDGPRSHSKIHSPKSHAENKFLQLHLESEIKPEKSAWAHKEIDKKLLKDKSRQLEVGNILKAEHLAHKLGSCEKGDAVFQFDSKKGSVGSGSVDWKSSVAGPNTPTSSFGYSSSGWENNGKQCQTGCWGREDCIQELTATKASSPENQFLEAIALSGEKQCDIHSYKTVYDSREPYRTRVCSSDSLCDNDSNVTKKKKVPTATLR